MAEQPLRVAIIGYGMGGEVFHAPLVAATEDMEVSYVVTGNEQRAAAAQARYPAVTVVANPDELWRHGDVIDLVVVTSPNRAHVPQALAAIGAGLPVVVDKPFAVDVEQAQSVLDAATSAGVAVTVFQNRRWDGDFLTLRKLLDDGALGSVTRFESRFERWRPTPKGGWRETGGADEAAGLLYDLGAHLIDQALQLFGPVTTVYCEADQRRAGVSSDDDTFIALTHAGGVRSHLWVSAVASDLAPRMRVLGDRASYVKFGLDVQEAALREGRRPDLETDWGVEEKSQWGLVGTPDDLAPAPTEPGSYQQFYATVARALRGEAAMPVDPRDSIEGLRIIAAAQRSHREGIVVPL
jgi:predicted dehydrogenase